MRVYAVVSAFLDEAIDLFVRREDAEAMVAEIQDDEPELAEALAIEEIPPGELSLN